MVAVMPPAFQIAEVVLVSVSLFFKPDVAIGFQPVPVFYEENEPFCDIPDEEWQVEQFALLANVYQLMVQFLFVERCNREDDFPQCNGEEVLPKWVLPDMDDDGHGSR